jgi:SM-20-related protein
MTTDYIPNYEHIINQLLEQHYSIVDNFFSNTLLDELYLHLNYLYSTDKLKKSAIGKLDKFQILSEIRGDYIHWIDEQNLTPAETNFYKQLQDFIDYLNRTCYMGIVDKELHYAVYPEGTYYKKHLDVFHKDQKRKLSFILYLNKDWDPDNGGELIIYTNTNNIQKEIVVVPYYGRLVVFDSQLLEHEVKLVKNTNRFSITGWFKLR